MMKTYQGVRIMRHLSYRGPMDYQLETRTNDKLCEGCQIWGIPVGPQLRQHRVRYDS